MKVPDYEDLANHVFPSHAPRAVKSWWSVSRGARTSHWATAERYPKCRFVHTEGNAAERDTCGCRGDPAWSETLTRGDASYLRSGRYLAWLVSSGRRDGVVLNFASLSLIRGGAVARTPRHGIG